MKKSYYIIASVCLLAVSCSGGESLFDGNAVVGGSISGGNSVSLSAYTASGGGPGGPGGGGRR